MNDPDRVEEIKLCVVCPHCAGAGVLLDESAERDTSKDVTIRVFSLSPRPARPKAHAKWAKNPGSWSERRGNIIATCEPCEGSGFLASEHVLKA